MRKQTIQRYAELGYINYGWTLADYLLFATVSRHRAFNEVLVYGGQNGSGPARRLFTKRLTKIVNPHAKVFDAGESEELVRAFKPVRRGRIPILALDLTQLPSSSMSPMGRAVMGSRPYVVNFVLSIPRLEELPPSIRGLATFMVEVEASGAYTVMRNVWDIWPRRRKKARFAQVLIEAGKVAEPKKP